MILCSTGVFIEFKAVHYFGLLAAEQMNHNIQFESDDNNTTTVSLSSKCVWDEEQIVLMPGFFSDLALIKPVLAVGRWLCA